MNLLKLMCNIRSDTICPHKLQSEQIIKRTNIAAYHLIYIPLQAYKLVNSESILENKYQIMKRLIVIVPQRQLNA